MNVVRQLHAVITSEKGHKITLEGHPTWAKVEIFKSVGKDLVSFTVGASELSVLRDLFQAAINEVVASTSPIVLETVGKDPKDHGGQDDCG